MMFYSILFALAGSIIVAYGVEFIFALQDDPREPPRVASRMPMIGHIIGFMLYGFEYYNKAGRYTNSDVYTVAIFNMKVYVLHSAKLATMTQKMPSLSVKPFLLAANKIHTHASDEAHAIFEKDLYEPYRERTRDALSPGPALDDQTLRMGRQAVIEVQHLLKQSTVELLDWTKSVILQCTSSGFYGMDHPFRDPRMARAMWTWDKYRPFMHIGILDPLQKGNAARKEVVDALGEYFKDIPIDASLFVRERHKVLRDGGITQEDAMKMHTFLNDGNFNIVPTIYWALYDIYSRPELLEAIRSEIWNNALKQSSHGLVLDISAIKTSCPLLTSSFQETQRTKHSLSASRSVLENTILGGRYLLKKGNSVYLPAKPIHEDTQIWGADASTFNPYRFVPTANGDVDIINERLKIAKASTDSKATTIRKDGPELKVLPSSFLAWGNAPYICPTRQMTSAMILIIIATTVMKADLTPTNGSDWGKQPATAWVSIATLPTPGQQFHLKVTPTERAAESWTAIVGKEKTAIRLASG